MYKTDNNNFHAKVGCRSQTKKRNNNISEKPIYSFVCILVIQIAISRSYLVMTVPPVLGWLVATCAAKIQIKKEFHADVISAVKNLTNTYNNKKNMFVSVSVQNLLITKNLK
ncbi:uncharacterized protein [Eurosta solidaginis]|uniref:uncharacterized protein n=1 Tax=Eurosta solidaginis TaxID=178769 RepID=UPI003530D34E